jgi:hypothetical protein
VRQQRAPRVFEASFVRLLTRFFRFPSPRRHSRILTLVTMATTATTTAGAPAPTSATSERRGRTTGR